MYEITDGKGEITILTDYHIILGIILIELGGFTLFFIGQGGAQFVTISLLHFLCLSCSTCIVYHYSYTDDAVSDVSMKWPGCI